MNLKTQDLANSILASADRVKDKFALKNTSYGGESALHNFEQTAIRFFGDASLENCFKVGMILMDKHLVTLAKNGIRDKECLDRLEDVVVYSDILIAMREEWERQGGK